MRRLIHPLGLALLSPLVAEFLFGDFPITHLFYLILLAPTYGGAAVLIRETARRVGLGWPSIVLMALAYGVLEEGIMTMSLFNPNFAGMRLLDSGYIPALGIGASWTLFALGLHTVWSVSVPIALAEELAGEERTTPWLGPVGLGVAAVLAVLGAAVTTYGTYRDNSFIASVPQLVSIVVIVIALVALAFRLPRRTIRADRQAPSPWLVLGVTLVAGVVFEITLLVPFPTPLWATLLALVASEAGMAVLALTWSARQGWDGRHRMALAGGALLTYVWHVFFTHPMVAATPAVNLISHIVFGLGAVILLVLAARRAGATAVRSR